MTEGSNPGTPLGRPIRKAFELLELLSKSGPVGLAELARRAGMPKSSVHRVIGTLVDTGLVAHTPRGYELGEYAFDIGRSVATATVDRLRTALSPHLARLREVTGGVVGTGVLSGGQVWLVDIQHDLRHAAVVEGVPTRLPAHCTALGRALLADHPGASAELVRSGPLRAFTPKTTTDPRLVDAALADVRSRGVAIENGEVHVDMIGIAIPLRFAEPAPHAAIGVWSPVRTTDVEATAVALQRTAHAVRLDLARTPWTAAPEVPAPPED